MPNKKAASGGEAQKAPAKPTSGAVNGKKPAQQKEQQPKAQQKSSQETNQGEQNNQGEGQFYRKRSTSSDPNEEVILQRMDAIQQKINTCRGELDKMKKTIEDKRAIRDSLFGEQDQLKIQLKEIENKINQNNDERQKVIKQLQEVRRVKKLKWDEANKFKSKLTFTPPDDDDDTYNPKLEEQIKKLETALSQQSNLSLQEEKKLVSQIDQLQQAKKHFREYKNIRALIRQDEAGMKVFEAALDKIKLQFDELKEQKDEVRAKLNAINSKIADAKASVPVSDREQIWVQLKQYQEELAQERNSLAEYRDKRNEERREKMKQEREKDRQRRAENQEKRKQQELERKQQELLGIPYQDEVDLCDHLIVYLESFLPKRQDAQAAVAASTPAPTLNSNNAPEGVPLKKEEDDQFTSKKYKNKKQKKATNKTSQELKHNVDVFLHFETLSLVPPSKVADVETSIAQLRGKKEHYQKLAAAEIQARQQENIPTEDKTSTENIPDSDAKPTNDEIAEPANDEIAVAAE